MKEEVITVKFYDIEQTDKEYPPLAEYSKLDENRVAASIAGECSGYVCQYCQEYVEFYKLGLNGGVHYNCGCVF